jgi:insulysin
VGHEGEGSLLSALKREGLAEGLSASTGPELARRRAVFGQRIAHREGGRQYEDVLKRLFAYLDLLREEGPQARIYAEQGALSDLAFRFREPTSPMGYVSSLSNDMHYYATRTCFVAPT